MRSHVQQTIARCFAILRHLHSIWRSVPTSIFQTPAVSLVLSKLDYGNAMMVDLPANLLNRLQSMLNATARSIAGLRRSAHITDTLASFYWLHAPEQLSSSGRLFHSSEPVEANGHSPTVTRCDRWAVSWLEVDDRDGVQQHCIPSSSRECASVPVWSAEPSHLVTVGKWSFASTGPKLWNTLPDVITSASSLTVFQQKTENTFILAIISGH